MSEKFRVLYDDNGNMYQFDVHAFKKKVNQMVADKKNSGIKISKEALKNEIAEKANVSPETVKKWMWGSNGPSDIISVKKCAEVLETRYEDMLILVNEEEKLTETEIKVICSVYEAILNVVFKYGEVSQENFVDDIDEYQKTRMICENNYKFFNRELNTVRDILYRNSLMISDDVFNKLNQMINGENVYEMYTFTYPRYKNRTSFFNRIGDGWISRAYLEDEIDFAQSLNIKVKEIDQYYEDNLYDQSIIDEEMQYGVGVGHEDYEDCDPDEQIIRPIDVFKYAMTRELKYSFSKMFPNLM